MSTDSIASSHHRRRRKSREVTSRYLSSSSSYPTNPTNNPSLSPVRRHPVFDPNHRHSFDYPTSTKTLWPKVTSADVSSTSSSSLGFNKIGTLAEHLANLRLNDLLSDRFELNVNKSSSPATSGNALNRFRKSSSESNRFIQFEKCVSYDSESSAASVRKTASFSSYMSPTTSSTTRWKTNKETMVHVSSKFMQDSVTSSTRVSNGNVLKTEDSPKEMHNSIMKSAMRRANSLTSRSSLSPGRIDSSFVSVDKKDKLLKSYSNLKPPTSPRKSVKRVEKLLNLGIDLFKSKKVTSINPVLSAASAITEDAHKLKLLHCKLLQWRFTNARAKTSSKTLSKYAEVHFNI